MTDQPMEPTPARVEMQRGADADAALANPLIAEALSAWESEITRSWQTSPLRDVEGRERLRLMLEASKSFRAYLLQTMQTGQLARETMLAETRLQQERQRTMQEMRTAPWK
jgi:hypothetical protein